MVDPNPVWHEVRPGGKWDPDASKAAAKLSAYFELEEARAARRLLSRVVMIGMVLAVLLEATTRIVSANVFLRAFLRARQGIR